MLCPTLGIHRIWLEEELGGGVSGQKSFENQLWSVSKDTGKNLKERNRGLLLSFTHSINLYFGPIACQALGPLQALS